MNKGGRPTVMTPEVMQKLREGFLRGYTDAQACFYAGINPDSLYTYIKSHPEYSEKKKLYKENIKILAKDNVYQALVGDGKANLKNGLDVLDRLEKENYSTKQQSEQLGADGEVVVPTIEVVFKDK